MKRNFKLPQFKLQDLNEKKRLLERQFGERVDKQLKKLKKQDVSAAAAFIAALTVMIAVGAYVVSRLSEDRAHRNKWYECGDCDWS